jgi:hypothetical protein
VSEGRVSNKYYEKYMIVYFIERLYVVPGLYRTTEGTGEGRRAARVTHSQ